MHRQEADDEARSADLSGDDAVARMVSPLLVIGKALVADWVRRMALAIGYKIE